MVTLLPMMFGAPTVTTVSVTFFSSPAPNSDKSCDSDHSLIALPPASAVIWADDIL